MEYIFVCPKCVITFGCNDLMAALVMMWNKTVHTGFDTKAGMLYPEKFAKNIKKRHIQAAGNPELKQAREEEKAREEQREQAKRELSLRLVNFLSTTTNTFDGFKIKRYIGIESGEIIRVRVFFLNFPLQSATFGNTKFLENLNKQQAALKS